MSGRGRILVVEDDADIRELIADALREAGAPVDVAVDGLDALERLRTGPLPAAILLDLRLPRLGGEAVLRAVRADVRYDAVAVVTMSAGYEPKDARGVHAHLRKPFGLAELLETLLSLSEANAA